MSDQITVDPASSDKETLAHVMIHVHNASQFNKRGAAEQVSRCLESARQRFVERLAFIEQEKKVQSNG